MHSATFTPDIDPDKRTYNIHLIAELEHDEQNDEVISSKDLLASLENLLTKEHGFEMVASQCGATDGEFASVVWIDDDPVPFTELVESQRRRAAFEDREDAVELYQRTDMRWDWRVFANNGNIIATSGGQGYENRGDAAAMIYSLLGPLPIAVTALHANTQPALWNGEGSISLDVPEVAKGEDD